MSNFEDDKNNDDGRGSDGSQSSENKQNDGMSPAFKKLVLWRRSPDWLPPRLRADALRAGVKALIEESAPYACMLTINFAHPYSDRFLLRKLNEIIKKLNRELFRRRFDKRQERLEGIVSVEVCRDDGVLNNCLHFHILIQPCRKFDSSNVEEVLSPLVVKIVEGTPDELGRPISNTDLVKVSPYTGIGTLPNYLTKEFELRGVEAVGFIGFLSFDGVEGLNIPTNRKKQDLLRGITK